MSIFAPTGALGHEDETWVSSGDSIRSADGLTILQLERGSAVLLLLVFAFFLCSSCFAHVLEQLLFLVA